MPRLSPINSLPNKPSLSSVNSYHPSPSSLASSQCIETYSLPPPLIPASQTVAQLVPMSQIHINQHSQQTAPTQPWQLPNLCYQLLCQQSTRDIIIHRIIYNLITNSICHHPTHFFIKFLTKVCQGCRSGYKRDDNGNILPPPDDIVVGHLSAKHIMIKWLALLVYQGRFVHYHVSSRCIYVKHPDFHPTEVHAPNEVLGKLHNVHKWFLNKTFGLNF